MEQYIFFNGYQYKTCTHEESLQHISGFNMVFCSSFFWSESAQNLNDYAQKSCTKLIPKSVFDEILAKKSDPNYRQYFSSDKEKFLHNLKVVSTATETNLVSDGIRNICDIEPSLIEGNNIVLCSDPHEAAYSLARGKPYLYKIDESDLKKYNGVKNYRTIHIKKVNILANEIKKI